MSINSLVGACGFRNPSHPGLFGDENERIRYSERMDINVALLPEHSLSEQLAELSQRLAPLGNTLLLDPNSEPLPHLTLYLTGFEEDSVATIPILLEGNLVGLQPPALSIEGVTVSPQGTVLLNVHKTTELDSLHRWMIHKLNPFRMRARPRFWDDRRERLSPQEIARLEQLGFPQALDEWAPHFTIGKLDPTQAAEVGRLLGAPTLHGAADCIGVGEVGAHGSFIRLVGKARFPTK
jgi:hypothetical protein